MFKRSKSIDKIRGCQEPGNGSMGLLMDSPWVTAIVQVQFLAWELPHVSFLCGKKGKERKEGRKEERKQENKKERTNEWTFLSGSVQINPRTREPSEAPSSWGLRLGQPPPSCMPEKGSHLKL